MNARPRHAQPLACAMVFTMCAWLVLVSGAFAQAPKPNPPAPSDAELATALRTLSTVTPEQGEAAAAMLQAYACLGLSDGADPVKTTDAFCARQGMHLAPADSPSLGLALVRHELRRCTRQAGDREHEIRLALQPLYSLGSLTRGAPAKSLVNAMDSYWQSPLERCARVSRLELSLILEPPPIVPQRGPTTAAEPAPTRAPAAALVLKHSESVAGATVRADGGLVAVSTSKAVSLWDGQTGVLLGTLTHGNCTRVEGAFSPDGKMLFTVWEDRSGDAISNTEFVVWDVSTRRELSKFPVHPNFIPDMQLSSDGARLVVLGSNAASGEQSNVKMFDARTGQLLWNSATPTRLETRLAFSPDGRYVAHLGALAAEEARQTNCQAAVVIWDASAGKPLRKLLGKTHPGGARPVFSPDGSTLAWSVTEPDWSGSVTIWDIGNGAALQTLNVGKAYPASLAFSPDGSLLALAVQGYSTERMPSTTIKLWDMRSASARDICTAPGPALHLAFSPDGRSLNIATYGEGATDDAMKVVWFKREVIK